MTSGLFIFFFFLLNEMGWGRGEWWDSGVGYAKKLASDGLEGTLVVTGL